MFDIQSIASSSAANCWVVNDNLMIDCGASKKQMMEAGLNLSEITDCLISHEHQDHCKAVKEILRRAVNVYALPETIAAMSVKNNRHRIHVCRPHIKQQVGDYMVTLFEGHHDVPVVGFKIAYEGETLVYLTDTAYCEFTFDGLTSLIIECNYDPDTLEMNIKNRLIHPEMAKRVIRTHFGLENVIEFIKHHQGLRKVRVGHLSDHNANEQIILKEIEAVVPDGCTVTIANKSG